MKILMLLCLIAHQLQCFSCGLLFGLFFTSAAALTDNIAVKVDFNDKVLVVVRTGLADNNILYLLLRILLDDLLQSCLVILEGTGTNSLRGGSYVLKDKALGTLKAAAVEIYSGCDGLEHIRKDTGTVVTAGIYLTVAQTHIVADAKASGELAEGALAYKSRTVLGESALRKLWKIIIKIFGCDETQNGVAQELKTLVAAALMLIGVGGMSQGSYKELLILKAIADLLFKLIVICFHMYYSAFLPEPLTATEISSMILVSA